MSHCYLFVSLAALALALASPSLGATYNTGDPNGDPTPRNAPAMVPVGPGNTDGSPRQIVRTSRDVLYVIAPAGTVYSPTAPTTPRLLVHGANAPGTPTGFITYDANHSPGGGVNASASAVDGADQIHSVWITPGKAGYGVFDTVTNTWVKTLTLAATGWTNYGQGDEGAAIALDASGNAYAVWNYVDPATGLLRLHLAIAKAGVFAAPVQVDDVDANGGARHPTVGFAPNGDFVVAWIDGDGDYQQPGTVRTRVLHPSGQWDASYAVSGVTAGSSLDQSCSLMITADGRRHITFLDDNNVIQYFYDKVDGKGWRGDQQPPYQITHDPVLGPDGAGGLYIYGHSTPQIGGSRTNSMGVLIDGDGNGKHRFHKSVGATTWSGYDLVRDGLIDDATTARWSQFFYYHPEEVDFTWWNHTVGTFDASGYYLEVGIDTLGGPVLAGTTVLQSQPILPPPEYSTEQQAAHPSIAGGTAQAFAVVAMATGVAAKIGLYIDDTNQARQALVGLYADAAGQPGALLAQTTFNCGVTCRGQWHELTLGAAPAIAIYKRYWIALLPVPTGGPLAYRAATTGAPVVTSASAHLTALPATWKSAPGSTKATLAGYVVGR